MAARHCLIAAVCLIIMASYSAAGEVAASSDGTTTPKHLSTCGSGAYYKRGGCVCRAGHGPAAPCDGNADATCCKPCGEWQYSPGGSKDECKACAMFKLTECAEKSYCDKKKGNVIVWKKNGTPCREGGGTCQDQWCKCKPGRGGSSCETCKPGFWSPGKSVGMECDACPSQAICKSIPGPCQMFPPCDPVNGKPTSLCWVDKPDGAMCNVKGAIPGPGEVDGAADGEVCISGQCVEAGTCPAGTGGPTCQPCERGFWSNGTVSGEECQPCPPRKPTGIMCRIPGPCDMVPTCDTKTGEQTAICWEDKPDGAFCNLPGAVPGPGEVNGGDTSKVCVKGDCVDNKDACSRYPCTQGFDCGFSLSCPVCKEVSPRTYGKHNNGRRCICPDGYWYSEKDGCVFKGPKK